MPQLPSGLHVGIDPTPLSKLLEDGPVPWNIHKVMAIRNTLDLYPYIDIILLVPDAQANAGAQKLEFLANSLPRPAGLVPVRSGFRLSQYGDLAAQWTDGDKTSFEDFLATRAQSLFDNGLNLARKIQGLLRNTDDTQTRLLVGWWDAGCHPAQEEGWAESDVGGPDWDDYDVLAALGQVRAGAKHHQDFSESQAMLRLRGVWAHFCSFIPQLHDWPDPDLPVRSVADAARAGEWLQHLPDTELAWLHRQAIVECIGLWSALGDDFRRMFPQPYGIIELIIVSAEANEFFIDKVPA